MTRIIAAILIAVLGLAVLVSGLAPRVKPSVPDVDLDLYLLLRQLGHRDPLPDTWRAISADRDWRLSVTPKVGLDPLTITVRYHVPRGLYGVASLTATQTDLEPPMVTHQTSRDLQGLPDVLEARWVLSAGLYEVAGCVGGNCVRRGVVVG